MAEIKWAYDENTGSFSALPASSWLSVAIGWKLMMHCVRHFAGDGVPESIPNYNHIEYLTHRDNYHRIIFKILKNMPLTKEESDQYYAAIHPSWSKPGETWSY